MGSMLDEIPAGVRPEAVYVIYSADILGPEQAIEGMSPARHLAAGYTAGSDDERAGQEVASRFTLTEGDDQYDYGYLGDESGNASYYPAGYTDKEGLDEPGEDTPEERIGEGRHRKWVAELTCAEWLLFADRYIIDVDERGLPVDYEDTLGSLTEYGCLPAIAVDNSEGWGHPAYGNGYVIDSQFYLSFAFSGADMPAAVVSKESDEIVARFFTPEQASEYIASLPGTDDGKYHIDVTEAEAGSQGT